MQYVLATTFLAITAAALGLFAFARRENRLGSRPSLAAATRALRRSRLVVTSASGECSCGGVTGPTGTRSRRYGQILACTSCGETWTEDGRRIILRRRPRVERRVRRIRRPVGH